MRRRGAVGLCVLLAACGGGSGAPSADGPAFGGIPALSGVQVMVFPVQRFGGLAADPTPELVFALSGAPQVRWLTPDDLQRALRSSPGLDVRMENLPVDVFLAREVRRIGDPLYGVLRRLAALTDAEVALIPVAVRHRVPVATGEGPPAAAALGPGHLEVVATLISPRTGRVFWTGVVQGRPGAVDDPGALASVMETLVSRLAPGGGGAP